MTALRDQLLPEPQRLSRAACWLRRPAKPRGRVTLAGLVVEQDGREPRLFPWTQVARTPLREELVTFVDEEGNTALDEHGRILTARIADPHERFIAFGAWRRAWLRQWENSTLHARFSNPFNARQQTAARIFALGILIVLLYAGWHVRHFFLSFAGWLAQLSGPALAWAVATMLFMMAAAAFIAHMCFGLVRDIMRQRGNVQTFQITPDLLKATLLDGRTIEAPWQDVAVWSGNKILLRLRLVDGTELRLAASPRLILALRIALTKTYWTLEREQQARRSRIMRYCVYSVVVAALVAFGVLNPLMIAPGPGHFHWSFPVLMAAGAAGAFALALLIVYWMFMRSVRKAKTTRNRARTATEPGLQARQLAQNRA